MYTTASLPMLVYRVSCALAYIPGVRCAAPPYQVANATHIGHGVTVHNTPNHVVVFTCHVVLDTAVLRSLPEQCMLIQSVAHAVIAREHERKFRIDVVVTAIDIKGAHASHRTD